MGGGKRKVELRDKGKKSLGESTDCNLSARNEQDNIKWGAVSWTIQKAKCTQKVFFFPFKSTILLQFISNATIYSTPKMVISIINTESQFLKLIFLSYKSSTLFVCVGFFSFWKWECLTFHLEIGFSRKATLKIPRKLKQFTLFFSNTFCPFFKLRKQKIFSGTKTKKQKQKQPQNNI